MLRARHRRMTAGSRPVTDPSHRGRPAVRRPDGPPGSPVRTGSSPGRRPRLRSSRKRRAARSSDRPGLGPSDAGAVATHDRPVRVGQRRPPQQHDVQGAGPDGLVGGLRDAEVPARGDRDTGLRPDPPGPLHPGALLAAHRVVRVGGVAAEADVGQVEAVLAHPADRGDRLVEVRAVGVEVVGAQAHGQRILLRPHPADGVERLQQEPRAVLQAAAVGVGAAVGDRREEARPEVAVREVQLHPPVPGLGGAAGGVGVGAVQAVDLVDGQLVHGVVVLRPAERHRRRSGGQPAVGMLGRELGLALPGELLAALAAGVGQLDPCDPAHRLDHGDGAGVPGDLVVAPEPGAVHRGAPLGADGDLLAEDESESARRPGAEVHEVEVAHVPVVRAVHGHRRHRDAVAQGHALERERAEQGGVVEPEPLAQLVPGAVEHRGVPAVRGDLLVDDDVRRHRRGAVVDRPDVQVVHVGDSLDGQQRRLDLLGVDALGRPLQQDVRSLAQQRHRAREDQRDDEQRGDRVRVGPAGRHQNDGGGEHTHRAEGVAEDVQHRTAHVHVPAVAAGQDGQRHQVADQAEHADDQQRQARDLGGHEQPLHRLDAHPRHDRDEGQRVQRGDEHLGPAHPVGPRRRRRSGGEHAGDQRSDQRPRVGQQVAEVGQQRERAGVHRARRAEDRRDQGDAQCPGGDRHGLDAQRPVLDADPGGAARADPPVEQHRRQRVVELAADGAAQRTRPELGGVPVLGEQRDGVVADLEADVHPAEPVAGVVEQQPGDPGELLGLEPAEDDGLVDPVQELGPEDLPQPRHQPVAQHRVLPLGGGGARAGGRAEAERGAVPGDQLRPDVGRHDDHRVAEVDGAALAVGEPAVVEHLQQRVEHVRVRLLDLVEQQHRVRPPPHRLGQLAGLAVADVAGRRPDHPRDGVLLAVLAHVEADHAVLLAEQRDGQGARQLGLADPGRAEEQEAADGAVLVAQPGARPADGLGHGGDGGVLPDDALVQLVLQPEQPVPLGLGQLRDRDAGGARHDLGDLLDADDGCAAVGVGGVGGQLLAGGGDLVAQLGGLLVVLVRDGLVLVALQRVEALLDGPPVHGGGAGAQPHPGTGLVEQVDRLVRQEPVGDVAVGELDGGAQRVRGVADLVVGLVAVGEPAQDRDGVLHRRLGHQDRLEAAGQRGVGLDVAAVLVERGGADDVQLAAGQRRLEHVAGVHRAAALTATGPGADHRVQLVDEHDQRVAVRPDLLDQRAHAFLEVAAVLGAGDHPGQVQLHDPASAQGVGHLAVGDALGDALDDGGLADTGLTDQHRVVLGAAGEDLDGLLDLVVAPDHRVQPAAAGGLGEVLAVLVQGRGAGVRDRARVRAARRARPGGGLRGHRAGAEPGAGEQPARGGVLVGGEREQQVLGSDVARPERAGDLVRVEQRALGRRRQRRRPPRVVAAAGAWQALLQDAGDRVRVAAGPGDPAAGGVRAGAGQQDVRGVEVGVTAFRGLLGGPGHDLAGTAAQQPRQVDPVHRAAGVAGAEEAGHRPPLVGSGRSTAFPVPGRSKPSASGGGEHVRGDVAADLPAVLDPEPARVGGEDGQRAVLPGQHAVHVPAVAAVQGPAVLLRDGAGQHGADPGPPVRGDGVEVGEQLGSAGQGRGALAHAGEDAGGVERADLGVGPPPGPRRRHRHPALRAEPRGARVPAERPVEAFGGGVVGGADGGGDVGTYGGRDRAAPLRGGQQGVQGQPGLDRRLGLAAAGRGVRGTGPAAVAGVEQRPGHGEPLLPLPVDGERAGREVERVGRRRPGDRREELAQGAGRLRVGCGGVLQPGDGRGCPGRAGRGRRHGPGGPGGRSQHERGDDGEHRSPGRPGPSAPRPPLHHGSSGPEHPFGCPRPTSCPDRGRLGQGEQNVHTGLSGSSSHLVRRVVTRPARGPRRHAVVPDRCGRRRARRRLLRRARLVGPDGRLGLHLRVRHARRGLRLDHRLGPAAGVRARSRGRLAQLVRLPGVAVRAADGVVRGGRDGQRRRGADHRAADGRRGRGHPAVGAADEPAGPGEARGLRADPGRGRVLHRPGQPAAVHPAGAGTRGRRLGVHPADHLRGVRARADRVRCGRHAHRGRGGVLRLHRVRGAGQPRRGGEASQPRPEDRPARRARHLRGALRRCLDRAHRDGPLHGDRHRRPAGVGVRRRRAAVGGRAHRARRGHRADLGDDGRARHDRPDRLRHGTRRAAAEGDRHRAPEVGHPAPHDDHRRCRLRGDRGVHPDHRTGRHGVDRRALRDDHRRDRGAGAAPDPPRPRPAVHRAVLAGGAGDHRDRVPLPDAEPEPGHVDPVHRLAAARPRRLRRLRAEALVPRARGTGGFRGRAGPGLSRSRRAADQRCRASRGTLVEPALVVPAVEQRPGEGQRVVGALEALRDGLEPLHAGPGHPLDGRHRGAATRVVPGEGGLDVVGAAGPTRVQLLGQRDRVGDREHGARADGEVCGVRRVAGEDDVAVAPGHVPDLAELQPRRGPHAGRGDQRVPVERAGEDALEHPHGLVGRHRVEPQARPRLRRALHDAGADAVRRGVGVEPDPAGVGLLEREGERPERLARPEPHVAVGAVGDPRAEDVGPGGADRGPDPVRGDDDVRVRGQRVACGVAVGGDGGVEHELHADLAGRSLGQHLQQSRPADGVAVTPPEVHRAPGDLHDLGVPHVRRGPHPLGTEGVGAEELVEDVLTECDREAGGRAGTVALRENDLVLPARPEPGQDREVQTGRSTTDDHDLHTGPPSDVIDLGRNDPTNVADLCGHRVRPRSVTARMPAASGVATEGAVDAAHVAPAVGERPRELDGVGDLLELASGLLEPLHVAPGGVLDRADLRAPAGVVGRQRGAAAVRAGQVGRSRLARDAVEGVDQTHRVLHGQHGARADPEVRGVRGVAGQHEVAVAPGPVADLAEAQPGLVPEPAEGLDEPAPGQRAVEDRLDEPDGLGPGHVVQAQRLPGVGLALDDAGADPVRRGVEVDPHPARVGRLEVPDEGVGVAVGAEPDVGVRPLVDGGAEVLGARGADPAADAVGGDDQVGVEVGAVDRGAVLDRHAQLLGPARQHVEQVDAGDRVAVLAADVHRAVVADPDLLGVPQPRRATQGLTALGVVAERVVEHVLAVGDGEPVGPPRLVAFVHDDLVASTGPEPGEDRQIQTGRPPSRAGDTHASPLRFIRPSSASSRRPARLTVAGAARVRDQRRHGGRRLGRGHDLLPRRLRPRRPAARLPRLRRVVRGLDRRVVHLQPAGPGPHRAALGDVGGAGERRLRRREARAARGRRIHLGVRRRVHLLERAGHRAAGAVHPPDLAAAAPPAHRRDRGPRRRGRPGPRHARPLHGRRLPGPGVQPGHVVVPAGAGGHDDQPGGQCLPAAGPDGLPRDEHAVDGDHLGTGRGGLPEPGARPRVRPGGAAADLPAGVARVAGHRAGRAAAAVVLRAAVRRELHDAAAAADGVDVPARGRDDVDDEVPSGEPHLPPGRPAAGALRDRARRDPAAGPGARRRRGRLDVARGRAGPGDRLPAVGGALAAPAGPAAPARRRPGRPAGPDVPDGPDPLARDDDTRPIGGPEARTHEFPRVRD
ncbi:hypothetical protein L7F22_032224 [Adiantum nelumboides]|nr:hypothetical protein [Adiantum nelumboides]